MLTSQLWKQNIKDKSVNLADLTRINDEIEDSFMCKEPHVWGRITCSPYTQNISSPEYFAMFIGYKCSYSSSIALRVWKFFGNLYFSELLSYDLWIIASKQQFVVLICSNFLMVYAGPWWICGSEIRCTINLHCESDL